MLLRMLIVVFPLCFASVASGEILEGPADIERYGLEPDWYGDEEPTGVEWFVTRPGDYFTAATIEAGAFKPFEQHRIDTASLGLPAWRSLVDLVNTSDVLYLPIFGGNAPLYLGYRSIDGEDEVYGWYAVDIVQFQVIANIGAIPFHDKVVIGSAATVGEKGIIVGTLQAIPEPTALGLFVIGCLAITDGRRRGR